MAKLCPKGKAAAKRKFKVYPSAYANMYASGVCSAIAKARGMSKGQKRSAVARKQKASNTGPKPSNVRTLASKGGYIGSYISGDLGGVKVSNPSLKKYYKGMI